MSKVLNTLSAIGVLVMAATPLMAVGAAHAQETGAPAAHVFVADLDLHSPTGAAAFRRRVDVASEAMCARAAGRSLSQDAACRQAVYEEAVSKLGSDQRQDLATVSPRTSGWTVAAR